jgi:hypothetical protein
VQKVLVVATCIVVLVVIVDLVYINLKNWRYSQTPEGRKQEDLRRLLKARTLLELGGFRHPATNPESGEEMQSQGNRILAELAERYEIELSEWKPFPAVVAEIYQAITGQEIP